MTALLVHLGLACVWISIVVLLLTVLRRACAQDPVLRYRLTRLVVGLAIFVLPIQVIGTELIIKNLNGELQGNTSGRPVAPFAVSTNTGWSMLVEPTPATSSSSAEADSRAARQSKASLLWWLSVLYLIGVVILGANLLIRTARTHLFLFKCEQIPDAAIAGFRKRMRGMKYYQPNWLSKIKWLQSPELTAPACCWYGRPTVLLPMSFSDDLRNDQLDCIINHELTHLRRRDWLSSAMARLLLIVYWVNPLVWVLSRMLNTDREMSCDADVVRRVGSAKTYATTLLRLCELIQSRQVRSLNLVHFGQPVSLKERIQMLDRHNRSSSSRRGKIITVLAGLAIVGTSGFQFVVAQTSDPPPLFPSRTPERDTSTAGAIPAQDDQAPPVAGTVVAPQAGRSDREIYDHLVSTYQNAGIPIAGGRVTNQESIASAENAEHDETSITAKEIRLNLPEGSNLRAEFRGQRVVMQRSNEATWVEIQNGHVVMIDADGVVRIKGNTLPADPDSKIRLHTSYEREEVTMLMTGKNGQGESVPVIVQFDIETGMPAEEEKPAHKSETYELFDKGEGTVLLKMQWHYDMDRLKEEAGRQ